MTLQEYIIKWNNIYQYNYYDSKHVYLFIDIWIMVLLRCRLISPLWMGTSRSNVFWERWGQMTPISFCKSRSIWFLSSPPGDKKCDLVSFTSQWMCVCNVLWYSVWPRAILTSRAVRMRAMRVEVKWTDMSSSTGMFIRTSLWWQQREHHSQTQLSTPTTNYTTYHNEKVEAQSGCCGS